MLLYLVQQLIPNSRSLTESLETEPGLFMEHDQMDTPCYRHMLGLFAHLL